MNTSIINCYLSISLFCFCGLQNFEVRAQSVALPCGQLQTDSITASGATLQYTFEADSGDVVIIRLASLSANFAPQVNLQNPSQQSLVSNRQEIRRTLAQSGVYTLVVSQAASASPTGNFQLMWQKLNDPCNPVALDCGAVAADSIVQPVELDVYTVSLSPGEVINFRLLTTTNRFSVILEVFDDTGQRIVNTTNARTETITRPGTYALFVRYSSGTTPFGNYELIWQRATGACQSETLSCNLLTEGQLEQYGEVDVYTFTAGAGDGIRLYLFKSDNQFRPTMELFDPVGKSIQSSSSSLTRSLSRGGVYTLFVYHSSSAVASGAYQLFLQNLSRPCNAQSLECGLTRRDSLKNRLDIQTYTFAASSGERIFLNLQRTSSQFNVQMELFDPKGQSIRRTSGAFSETLQRSGAFTILVFYASGNDTSGIYALTYQRTISPCNAESLSCGQALTGSLEQEGELDAFIVQGTAGEKLLLEIESSPSGFSVSIDLFDPDGIPVANQQTSINERLVLSGNYTVLIRYRSGNITTGSYRLFRQKGNGGCLSAELDCGTLVAGMLDSQTVWKSYHFQATAGEMLRLQVNGITENFRPVFSLYDPLGDIIINSRTETSLFLPRTGVYTLFLNHIGSINTGEYILVRQDTRTPCGATALHCGEPTFGFLEGLVNLEAYTFEAAAGEVVLLRLVNTINAGMSLYDPDGQLISSNNSSINELLTQTGMYTLMVNSVLKGNYYLQFEKSNHPCRSFPLQECQVQNTITNHGEMHVYTLDKVAGDHLLLELRSSSPDFAPRMQLFDPEGYVLSASTSIDLPVITGGQYVIIVDVADQGNRIGTYTLTSNNTALSLQSPNGGELFYADSPAVITWEANFPEPGNIRYDLLLSTDGGQTFDLLLAEDLPASSNSFNLTIPSGSGSVNCRIRLLAKEGDNVRCFDDSNDNFTIIPSLPATSEIRYSYDALRRLTQVIYPDGARIEYTYDAAGNRLTRRVSRQ